MLAEINPKLPMRDKAVTKDYYLNTLEFQEFGSSDFEGYPMVQKDGIQIRFFEFVGTWPQGKLRASLYPNRQHRRTVPMDVKPKNSHPYERAFANQTLGAKGIFIARPRP